MFEQKIIIHLVDDFGNKMGKLSIRADCYTECSNNYELIDNMELFNIDIVDFPDTKTPIQYCRNMNQYFANLMFLENTQYQLLFESEDINSTYDVLFSLNKQNPNFFDEFSFNLSDESMYKFAGTLNFKSYVGKSFIDIQKNNIKSVPIPIEVRSKKIDYFNQYPAMIADLSKLSSGLIFEVNSPLYQEFELDSSTKNTFYEDFMLLEFLFREENLPSIYEYLTRNPYSQLTTSVEQVPIGMSSYVEANQLNNIFSNMDDLQETNKNFTLANVLGGYVPASIENINYIDSVDNPENRFFKYFLEHIYDLIRKMLINCPVGYVQDKLLLFQEEMNYYLSNRFFKNISNMEYIPYNSQVLQKREGYRDILDYFLMFEFSFRISWNELSDKFKGFEKKMSELYEYWCYLKLLQVLDDLSITKLNFENIFKINENKWSINIKRGTESENTFKIGLKGKIIEIKTYYNLSFSNKTHYKSYSLTFKPDYTLRIKYNNTEYFIHFDAKYRSEQEINDYYTRIDKKKENNIFKKDDVYKMHTYKDAILESEGAYVLYPGNGLKIYEESDFIIPSVGAFPLIPGNDKESEENLSIFLRKIFDKLTS